MAGLSKGGINFLKCAFASPDFAVDPGEGIPDDYDGLALMRKNVYTNNVSFTPAKDTWMLVMPTPGVAYWTCETSVGTFPIQSTEWTPNYDQSFESLFGTPTNQGASFPTNPVERSKNVVKFRYASNVVEVTPTSNFTQAAGSITVWKATIEMNQMVRHTVAMQTNTEYSLIGAEAVARVSPNNKPFKFMDGAFSMAVNTEPHFEFKPIMTGVLRIPPEASSESTNSTFGAFHGDFVGFGSLQSIVVRVSSPSSAVNTALVKVWSCLEYQPNVQSAFYEFAGTSPPKDEMALTAYRGIALRVPVAVSVAENDGFWQDRVLPLLRGFWGAATAVGTVVPQVGMAVSGMNALSSLFAGL